MARQKQRTVGDGPRSLRRGNGAQAPLMGAESWGGGGWGQTARDEQSGGVVPSRQPTGAHDTGDDKRRPSHGTNANGSTATGRVCSMRDATASRSPREFAPRILPAARRR